MKAYYQNGEPVQSSKLDEKKALIAVAIFPGIPLLILWVAFVWSHV